MASEGRRFESDLGLQNCTSERCRARLACPRSTIVSIRGLGGDQLDPRLSILIGLGYAIRQSRPVASSDRYSVSPGLLESTRVANLGSPSARRRAEARTRRRRPCRELDLTVVGQPHPVEFQDDEATSWRFCM